MCEDVATSLIRVRVFVAALYLLCHFVGHYVWVVHLDHAHRRPHVYSQRIDVRALANLARRIRMAEAAGGALAAKSMLFQPCGTHQRV